MSRKILYWSLAIGIVFLILITYFETPVPQTFVIETQRLFPVLTSVVTLFIGIALFDRYGYRKIIYEKKLAAVLELIEDLQKFHFLVQYRPTDRHQKWTEVLLIVRKSEIKTFKINFKQYLKTEAIILFPGGMHWQWSILKHTSNTYLPKNISLLL
jgi:hypothetical protein